MTVVGGCDTLWQGLLLLSLATHYRHSVPNTRVTYYNTPNTIRTGRQN